MKKFIEQIAFRDVKGTKKVIAKIAKDKKMSPSEFIRMAVNKEIRRIIKRRY